MQWQLALISIPPLLAFVAIRPLRGDRAALLGAIGVAALEWAYDSWQLGFVEPFTLTSLALFVLLGGLSIRRDDLVYFKLQPVALECILATSLLFYTFVHGKPLFAIIVQEHMGLIDAFAPWRRGYLEANVLTLSKSVPFVLLAHAGLVAWASFRLDFWRWFHLRVFGLYLMIALLFVAERLLQVSY